MKSDGLTDRWIDCLFDWQMTFALFCMIIGIVFYGYIIASVAAGLANADAQRARYQERLDAIKTFLEVTF